MRVAGSVHPTEPAVSSPLAADAVLFDFDLTLADSSAGVTECVNHALRGLGFSEVGVSDVKRTIGLSLAECFRQLSGVSDAGVIAELRRLFVERADELMAAMTQVFPEVPEVLLAMRQRGIKTGIVSTRFRYRICEILERYSLIEAVDIIVGGEDVRAIKPDPSGLLMALASLQVPAERALYIGDHTVDAAAAQAAGVAFVGVLTGTTGRDELMALGARLVLGSVGELLATDSRLILP